MREPLMLVVVLFVGCLVACAAALNLGQFVDDAAAVVWAAAAVVLAGVVGLIAAVALAAAVLTSRACAAVNASLVVDPGPGSAVVLVHVAE